VASVAAFSAAIQFLGSLTGQVREAIRETIDLDLQAREARQAGVLLELAAIAQADERARGYLSRAPDAFEDYRQALADTPFLAAFDRFVAEYGEHAAFETDPGWPRYREDPPSLLATIAHIAKAGVLPDGWGKEAGDAEDRDAGRKGLEKLRPWHRWLARLAVGRLSRLAKMRAELRALYGRAMTDCRAWDLRLAERWLARGWLAEPEDYFWLTMREVERALMTEAEAGPTLPALVRARQETYQTYAATEMPYSLTEADIARLVPGHGLLDTALSSVLSGWPVSPGQVQGRVLVLRRLEEADHMQEGVILVTPSTDAAWFHIFPQARGLIVETGGLLSHGSIIAREFGLPAVANIPEATTRFHDGDLVLLDGSTGLVQILDAVQDTPT
jgi:pyruvate,water dikinase